METWVTASSQSTTRVSHGPCGAGPSPAKTSAAGRRAPGHPSRTDAQDLASTAALISQSVMMARLRATGAVKSAGTYAARHFMIARKAVMACTPFGRITPTRSPGVTPAATRKPASLSARWFSSS